jgi:hypothetical protein
MLEHLKTLKEQLKGKKAMPHPCLAVKIVDTVLAMQAKISIFKRQLTSQYSFNEEVCSGV